MPGSVPMTSKRVKPRARLGFAALQQRPTNATAGMVGIDEERTDLGRIDSRVEFARIALGVAVATKQRAPAAPAAAADQFPVQLGHEIGAIVDELRVDPECAKQSCLDLLRLVILRSELAGGPRDQVLQGALISARGGTEQVRHRSQVRLQAAHSV